MKEVKAILLTVMLSTLAVTQPAKSDPGPVVQWLMDEPVSLFDLGMLRLDNHLRLQVSHLERIHKTTIGYRTDYDWSKNRILITISPIGEDFDKSRCETLINSARVQIGGFLFLAPKLGSSAVAQLFTHYGYALKGSPKKYREKLDEIIYVKVSMGDRGFCKSPLVRGDVLYSE